MAIIGTEMDYIQTDIGRGFYIPRQLVCVYESKLKRALWVWRELSYLNHVYRFFIIFYRVF